MELQFILKVLGNAILISLFIEGIVEILKAKVSLPIHPRIYSVLVGGVLGALSSTVVGDLYQSLLIGVVAGLVPAPVLHDLLEILREFKNNLRLGKDI
ncbi:MAG: hypothetical protein DDT23_01267 [candidate division WS2 bacterium]|nr:hypothetical protein [Candidatus Lithacetigena glycinireducens]